ncbi:unnamed protein product [Protopolystoma xenopodis]|uniref:Uncharacterized protein n=1 Tax=Protopolystoma xenopodis TaxID=117903 RepID=A0A3S4ZD79_9PLAT|nr:unnamed protein product [Protopolystoma xenopodis]
MGLVDGLTESREELEEIERWLQANSGGMVRQNNEAGTNAANGSRNVAANCVNAEQDQVRNLFSLACF